MSFPANVDSFTTKVDHVDRYNAADINAVQTSIVAIETALLTSPISSGLDVVSKSQPDVITALKTIGTGDSTVGYGTPVAAQLLRVVHGTTALPDTIAQSLVKFERTMRLTRAQVTGDGSNLAAAVQGINVVPLGGEVQGIGVMGVATTAATFAQGPGPDACGGYFVGRSLSGSDRTGIGAFVIGRQETGSTGSASALQVATFNGTGVDGTVNAAGFSSPGGILVTATSLVGEKSAVGLEFDNAFSTQFQVGIHFNGHVTGGLTGASAVNNILVNDNATIPIRINGTHSTAALVVASGSGPILIGEVAAQSNTSLLEVWSASGTSRDPLARFGSSGANDNHSIRLGNSTGTVYLGFVAGGAGLFLTGTVTGDTGVKVATSGKAYHIGGTASAVKFGNDNSVTFGSAPAFNAGFTVPAGQVASYGSGNESGGYAGTFSAQILDVLNGTNASPDATIKPTVKISRYVNLQGSQIPVGNGIDEGSAFFVSVTVPSTAQVQGTAITGIAKTFATSAGATGAGGQTLDADAQGITGIGQALSGSTRVGIGGFFEGTAVAAGGLLSGIQVNARNNTGTDATVSTVNFPQSGGLWITSVGTNRAAEAITIGNPSGQQFDVGLHASAQVSGAFTGGIATAFIQDDSTATSSIVINGTHTKAMTVASGAGYVLIGGTSQITAGTLLEVQGPASDANPLMTVGNSNRAQNYALYIRNSSGSLQLGIANGINNFITGSIAGDGVVLSQSANKFLHIGGTISLIRAGQNNTLTTYASTATPAGGSSTAHLDFGSSPALGIYFGSGAPTVSAPKGSLYLRTDGTTTNDRAYINTNGTTTWTSMTTAA